MKIGPVIRAIRERKAMNLKEFAELVGYDRSYVSRVERNERTPSLEYIAAVMDHVEGQDVFALLDVLGFRVDPLAARVHHILQEDSQWTSQRKSAFRYTIEAQMRYRG